MVDIKMIKKIFPFGSNKTPSYAIIIPKSLCKEIGIEFGEKVEFDYLPDHSALILKRKKKEEVVEHV